MKDGQIPAFLKKKRADILQAQENPDFIAALNHFSRIEDDIDNVEKSLARRSFFKRDIRMLKDETVKAGHAYIEKAIVDDSIPEAAAQDGSETIGPYYRILVRYLDACIKRDCPTPSGSPGP